MKFGTETNLNMQNSLNALNACRICIGGSEGGGDWLNESVKKGKFLTKIFFSVIVQLIKTTINKKIWWLYLKNFYKKQLQNVKYNIKRTCIFHLILFGIISILILFVRTRGWSFFRLTEKSIIKRDESYLSIVPNFGPKK